MAAETWAADASLRRGCFGVLRVIERASTPLSQREVSALIGIDASDVVDLVDRLERAGFVRRRRDEEDRRRNVLELTTDGLRAIERSRLRALVERDIGLAQQLHAPDFQLVTPGGRAFTREEYLGKIERGALRYLRWEPGAIDVRQHGGGLAVLRYRATLELDAGDGRGTPFECWHIDTYERNDPQWQVVWSQATAVS